VHGATYAWSTLGVPSASTAAKIIRHKHSNDRDTVEGSWTC